MIQQQFAEKAAATIQQMPEILGLAAGGSWISDEIDEFSDLDLVLVTKDRISGNKDKMIAVAEKLGDLLNAFTGEHVGEPRLLICLYDHPLLHVDLKFVTLKEFGQRVEDPAVLLDKEGALSGVLESTEAIYPGLDLQWLEDRFWTWVHYATLKIGRGEYFEALDFLSYMRSFVTGPLLQLKNGQLPRGMRKVEFNFSDEDLGALKATVATPEANSLFEALTETVKIYQQTRKSVFPDQVTIRAKTEIQVLDFLKKTRDRSKH